MAEKTKHKPAVAPERPVCLVTGCSSGIGKAVCLRLARLGWIVYATARNSNAIAGLEKEECLVRALDVTDARSVGKLVKEIVSEHGAIDVLINNAGYGQQGPFEETPVGAFRDQFETNVFAVVVLCQAVLPGMRAKGWGRIINISSIGGRVTFPGGAAYHGSKFALEAISDVLRFEVAGLGVKVVVVEPGPTSSGFGARSVETFDNLRKADGEIYDQLRQSIQDALESTFDTQGQQGISTADEVAEVVLNSLLSTDPEPRVVVGEMAAQLIELQERGEARDWDEFVARMYHQPTLR